MPGNGDLIRGTLDLLILRTLELEPMHGWGLTEIIERRSENALSVNQGSLYPALRRLTRRRWIRSEWRKTKKGRLARYYMLTPKGRKQLSTERTKWKRLSRGVDLVLDAG